MMSHLSSGQSSSVYKPFQEEVPSGSSSFTLTVPRHYILVGGQQSSSSASKKRDFFFSEFNLIPSFYSQRAAQFGLDSESELSKAVKLELRFSHTFNKENLYKLEGGTEIKFDQNKKAYQVDTFMQAVNEFFEVNKPEGVTHAPCFFDWISTEWTRPDPARYVPAHAELYYNDAEPGKQDLQEFVGALENSAKNVKGANNFLFPDMAFESEALRETIRIRLNVAPLTKMLFSTDTLLFQLGFTKAQCGVRSDYNRIVFENDSATEFKSFVGRNPPAVNLTVTTTTILPKATQDRSASEARVIETTMATFMQNDELAVLLQTVFSELSRQSNVTLKLHYSPDDRKFEIVFPQNPNISTVILCDLDLGERLGYGPVTRITQNLTPVTRSEQSLAVDAEARSRALAFDTGMLLATLDGATAQHTDALEEPLLATLLPTESGTFAMRFDRMLRSFQLPTTFMGNGHFPLKINLWTLINGSKKVPLNWKVDVTVGGILEGN